MYRNILSLILNVGYLALWTQFNVLIWPNLFKNCHFIFPLTIPWSFVFSDLEWKIIYVGSAESEEHDQVLDTVYVGPVPEGRHLFVFEVKFSISGSHLNVDTFNGNVLNVYFFRNPLINCLTFNIFSIISNNNYNGHVWNCFLLYHRIKY